MSKENQIRTGWVGFLVAVLLCSATGCRTPAEHRVLGRHLENYRKVYLVKTTENPRKVTPRVLSRLQLAGFDVTEVSFEAAKKMSQEAAEKGLSAPALICNFGCVSVGDPFLRDDFCFQTIRIHFYDLEKGDLVFKVSDFKYYPSLPENTELNRLFVEISDKFFPGQPNPFRIKK
jgi:hypothetical protein